MFKYIVRLDDACPTMNHSNWDKMERLLDRYGIKPIVGVIPDNMDPDFNWKTDDNFWNRVRGWQEKGWSIAIHGYHHSLHKNYNHKIYYQKSHSDNTEFAGVDYKKQFEMLKNANSIFLENGVISHSFFAPAHTFDENTILAIKKLGCISFVSDGYGIKPYYKQGMVFIPSICDGPIRFPFGVYTFVFHPSVMNADAFKNLKFFLKKNNKSVITIEEALISIKQSQGLFGKLIETCVYCVRGIRRAIKKGR